MCIIVERERVSSIDVAFNVLNRQPLSNSSLAGPNKINL